MSRQTPKGEQPGQAFFNQVTVERFTCDVSKAIGHSNSRNDRVAQVASFFSLIRNAAPSLAAATVMIEKAHTQMFHSPDGYQAAHYLPGQLKILAGQLNIQSGLPWLLLPNQHARDRLEHLFADVEHLPVAFNNADSAAEKKGLCDTFRDVGQMILRDPLPPRKGTINRNLVRRIYDELWVPGASKSYNDAFAQKSMASTMPPLAYDADGNIENLEERGSADPSRENEGRILLRYREALRTAPPSLRDDKMLEIERTIQG